MSNATKKPTGWNADEVLQEMRDWDHAEDWPSDISTLGRWAEVVDALIAERDDLRAGGLIAQEMLENAGIHCFALSDALARTEAGHAGS